jgi:hypothetical protein
VQEDTLEDALAGRSGAAKPARSDPISGIRLEFEF